MGSSRYLELILGERRTPGARFSPRSTPRFALFRALKKAEADRTIRGLVLNTAGFSEDRGYLWELRTALESFKGAGKKIAAYLENADLDLYCLASVADKIVLDDSGALSFLGYAHGRPFVRRGLEKLGIGVRELRYLEYKSAMETFTRSSFSEADRRQYEAYLDETFRFTRETLLRARSWKEEDFDLMVNRDFLYSPGEAKDRGLVDALGREEALDKTVRELEGGELSYLTWGDGALSLMSRGRRLRPYTAGQGRNYFYRKPEIALVYALGETDLDRGMAARSLARTMREAAERKPVKAMVVRVNSPGGSAVAADHIAQAIRETRERIPVVVSMGAVAGSGGYWAAMYAGHIAASPYTLTGSIGVIAGWFYDKGLYDTLGLSVDTLRRGDHADLFSGFLLPRRDLSPEEEERYRRYILALYRDFVEKAAAGRGMSVEAMEALAQGRVFSGLAAQKAGLVDSIGGLADALETARNLAEIPKKRGFICREYPKPKFYETLTRRFLSAALPPEDPPLFGVPALPALAPGLSAALPAAAWRELEYRISQNGRPMPIMPLSMTAPG
jgi:protease-4